jgi:hypothetical protein
MKLRIPEMGVFVDIPGNTPEAAIAALTAVTAALGTKRAEDSIIYPEDQGLDLVLKQYRVTRGGSVIYEEIGCGHRTTPPASSDSGSSQQEPGASSPAMVRV